jgi:hypothetical protein
VRLACLRTGGSATQTSGAALLLALALTACTVSSERGRGQLRAVSSAVTPAPVAALTRVPDAPGHVRARVAPLSGRSDADVLVVAPAGLAEPVRDRLAAMSAPGGSLAFRSGSVRVAGAAVPAVGVDASSFRRFTAAGTAESDAVWQAAADGGAVAAHDAAQQQGWRLGQALAVESLAVGAPASPPPTLRIAALATTGLPRTDLVLDERLAQRLGLPVSALLLTAPDGTDPVALAEQVQDAVGGAAQVDLLRLPASVARLTGGSAAEDLGSFSYRYAPDGSITPDADWVAANIRTETVPVLGRVTCHRLMLPQLRGALQDVVDAGLADTLHTYDGCYVPRFIDRDPARPISLHTWGIAVDMDAATNYRGIPGTMHPGVVEIFKRWGFRWGGDWRYTDPMHFELATITDRAG